MNKDEYAKYVKSVTLTTSLPTNIIMAFLVGGAICTFGQVLINVFEYFDLGQETSLGFENLILIGLAILLTGLNIYPKLAKCAGAGSLVPITGFANSVAACAIEFKKEGQIFGIGCKIFTIAGPVILYGLLSSSLLGFIYWIYTLFV